MKLLKISLVIIVIAAIGVGIFYWIRIIEPPPKPPPPNNVFINKIEKQIAQLKNKPDNKFCETFYEEVTHNINEFYNPSPPKYPFGRFGETQSENNQWKENFEKELYSVYANKFINQTYYVLRNSEWKFEDLNFIQDEMSELKNSKLLVSGSHVYKEFSKIQTALNKYYKIVQFISSCRNFSHSGSTLADRFPIADVQSKIQHADSLRQNSLENIYVNNCIRLHDGLKEIPQSLFNKHILYLENKINYWSGQFSNFFSQRDYSNNLYNPLKSEIEELDNNIYKVSNFESEYNRLLEKWRDDNIRAFNFDFGQN